VAEEPANTSGINGLQGSLSTEPVPKKSIFFGPAKTVASASSCGASAGIYTAKRSKSDDGFALF